MRCVPAGCGRAWAGKARHERVTRERTLLSGLPPCRITVPRAVSSETESPSNGDFAALRRWRTTWDATRRINALERYASPYGTDPHIVRRTRRISGGKHE